MKKHLAFLLIALMLTGCAPKTSPELPLPEAIPPQTETVPLAERAVPEIKQTPEIPYMSRFDGVTYITLQDDGSLVDTLDSGAPEDAVFMTRDILYYEDRDSYDSGNPYGEGEDWEKHTAEEAAEHTVVNITEPGAYQISGSLSAGQIRVDLGEEAKEDPEAVVELILKDVDITCTVGPAILFLNVYECDGDWSVEEAKAEVDTSASGANLILEGSNTVSGSHVARIFKDQEEEKKLWKQDGAIYSYQSMNVYGPGSLELTADNEGLDTELHLTVNGGNIVISSGNDGINTNEDGVSVTTINAGNLTIFAGLGEEGDGIDSNGYLVINGGTVIAAAKPAADAGLDSDLGSFVNGGTVIAMGAAMDWAESDSDQVTMNLQFAGQQKAGSEITVTKEDGTPLFRFALDSESARTYSGMILSSPNFCQGETYHVYMDGVRVGYTGNDLGRGGPGGGGFPGRGEGDMAFPEGEPPAKPEGFEERQPPEGFEDREPPEGFEDREPPEGFAPGAPGETFPEGEDPREGGFGNRKHQSAQAGDLRTDFYMNDMVNAFTGVAEVEATE